MFSFKKLFRKKQTGPATVPQTSAPAPMSEGEKRTKTCIAKCLEFLSEKLQSVIPSEGSFSPVSVYFDKQVPEWYMDQCAMRIRVSALDVNERVLEVFATFPEDDRMISNYFKTASNKELLAYMQNPDLIQEIYEAYAGFSESIRRSD